MKIMTHTAAHKLINTDCAKSPQKWPTTSPKPAAAKIKSGIFSDIFIKTRWDYDFSTLFLNESATSIKVSINPLKKMIAWVLTSAAPEASCIITTIIVAGMDAANACLMIWFINLATHPFWLRVLTLCLCWLHVEDVSLTRPIPTQGGASGVGMGDAVKLAR